MNDTILTAIVTAALTGAVNWGILSTKLAWMRRDIDHLEERVRQCENRHFAQQRSR